MKMLLKVIFLTAACILIAKSCNPNIGMNNQMIGQPAPDFTLPTLKGEEMNMTRFRKGQPALIFFWATWCPHCRTQLIKLTERRGQIENDGIQIILVDIGETAQQVRHYIDINNISFEVFLDLREELARVYRIVGVPTFFLLNEEGIIVAAENVLPGNYKEILLGGFVP